MCERVDSDLYGNPPGTGTHGYRANLHQEVTVSVACAATLDLVTFGVLKVALQLHHQHVEVHIGGQKRTSFKQSQAAQRGLGVVHHIQQLGGLT